MKSVPVLVTVLALTFHCALALPAPMMHDHGGSSGESVITQASSPESQSSILSRFSSSQRQDREARQPSHLSLQQNQRGVDDALQDEVDKGPDESSAGGTREGLVLDGKRQRRLLPYLRSPQNNPWNLPTPQAVVLHNNPLPNKPGWEQIGPSQAQEIRPYLTRLTTTPNENVPITLNGRPVLGQSIPISFGHGPLPPMMHQPQYSVPGSRLQPGHYSLSGLDSVIPGQYIQSNAKGKQHVEGTMSGDLKANDRSTQSRHLHQLTNESSFPHIQSAKGKAPLIHQKHPITIVESSVPLEAPYLHLLNNVQATSSNPHQGREQDQPSGVDTNLSLNVGDSVSLKASEPEEPPVIVDHYPKQLSTSLSLGRRPRLPDVPPKE